jgi:hypothetical protein
LFFVCFAEQFPGIHTLQVNLSNWDETKSKVSKHLEGHRINLLVNNAGIALLNPVGSITESDINRYASLSLSLEHFILLSSDLNSPASKVASNDTDFLFQLNCRLHNWTLVSPSTCPPRTSPSPRTLTHLPFCSTQFDTYFQFQL